jgi:hypothetical protein
MSSAVSCTAAMTFGLELLRAGDAAVKSQIKDFNAKLESTPAFFWTVTEGNDRRTQVNAGRAYVRARLGARTPRYTVQMWTRLGYGPTIGPSPRRELVEHIIKA